MTKEDMRLALAAHDDDAVMATVTHTVVTVGTVSTAVLAANSSRKYMALVNDSDETIYVALGTDASLNSGIRLNAGGGSLELTTWRGAVKAICASGSKKLLVTEG